MNKDTGGATAKSAYLLKGIATQVEAGRSAAAQQLWLPRGVGYAEPVTANGRLGRLGHPQLRG